MELLKKLIYGSLSSKLRTVVRATRSDRAHQIGRHVNCHLSISERPKFQFRFYASIVTNNSSWGGVDGTFNFFHSRKFPVFREGMLALTAEVARAAAREPAMKFFRLLPFCRLEDAEYYLSHRDRIIDADGWLERAVCHNCTSAEHFICERFESASWTVMADNTCEELDMITNEVREIRIKYGQSEHQAAQ